MNKKEGYILTGEVWKQIESLKIYLKSQNLNENTARQKSNYSGFYLNWLKTYNLRQVQYMFGHKYVSSTEL
jgi:hypothetical protein